MMERVFPAEIAGRVPCITLRGADSVLVEQHRGLVVCRAEEVSFRSGSGLLRIVGKELQLVSYSTDEAQVEGRVASVSIGAGEGK